MLECPAAEVHGPPPTRGGCLRRHAALAHRGGGAGGRHRGRVQPHGGAHLGPTPHEKAQSAASASHRMRFSVTSPPGRRGARPPASLRGTMESGPTGQTCSSNHPPGWRVVAPGPAGLGLGPGASRKSAVWQRASLMARPASGRRRPKRRRRGAGEKFDMQGGAGRRSKAGLRRLAWDRCPNGARRHRHAQEELAQAGPPQEDHPDLPEPP